MIIKDSKIIKPEDKAISDSRIQTAKTINLLGEIRSELQSAKLLSKEQVEKSSNIVHEATKTLQNVLEQGFGEASKDSKVANEFLDVQFEELTDNIILLKEDLVKAINEKDISKTKFATDINKNFGSVIELLKQIKEKKTTFIGGGGGGSNVPLVTSTATGNYSASVANPDGTNVGNTLGIPAHNNGTVTYPDNKTDVFTFKKDATTVAVVTIGYTDSTKASMSSWSIS